MKPENPNVWLEAQAELDRLLGLPEAPRQLASGQLWTLFAPEDDLEAEGVIHLVYAVHTQGIQVFPVGTRALVRTFLEPVLSGMSLEIADTDGALVPALHYLTEIPKKAFEGARYVGRVRPEGMGRLNDALARFQRIQNQKKKWQNGEFMDEDLDRALADGLFLDLPVCSFQELETRNCEFLRVLGAWFSQVRSQVVEFPSQVIQIAVKRIYATDFKVRKQGELGLAHENESNLAAAPAGLLEAMDVFREQEKTLHQTVELNSGRFELEVLLQGNAVHLVLHEKQSAELPELSWLDADQQPHPLEMNRIPGSNQWVASEALTLPLRLKAGQEWIAIEP